jgi:hypothetical protein
MADDTHIPTAAAIHFVKFFIFDVIYFGFILVQQGLQIPPLGRIDFPVVSMTVDRWGGKSFK